MPPRAYTTSAQAAFRRGGRKRLAGALLVAIAALIALVVFGPSAESVDKHFTYYGAPDDLQLMQEISIEDGHDDRRQLPQSLRQPPPPAAIQVEEEALDPRATTSVPPPQPQTQPTTPVANPRETTDTANPVRTEMAQPRQSNRDFVIQKMVQPEYPLNIQPSELRAPVIVVQVGIFVNTKGEVTEAMILSSEGSRAFEEAALTAVRQWTFKWLITPQSGRWLQFPFNFKSPYVNRLH